MHKMVYSVAALAFAVAATPAMAAITPFASFNPVAQITTTNAAGHTVRTNVTGNVKLTATAVKTVTGTGSNKFTATNYTYDFGTALNGGAFGAVPVKFQYLEAVLSGITINSDFTLRATTTTAPTLSNGTIQLSNISGMLLPSSTVDFSFVSTQAFTTSFGKTYAVGTNLLSGTFGPAATAASSQVGGPNNGTSGSLLASTGGGASVVFTSDVLNFTNTHNRDLGLSFSSITQPLLYTAGTSSAHASTAAHIRNFKALATGQFSSDPAPLVNGAVPEAATWAMMLVGFGAVGGVMRNGRRRKDLFAA